ncbi:MAG TPA: diaminopimelate decarboxylase [Actinomycetes bacterium]|nr:diaminopimelate decarboxylase [Actinomycetes bacterium]
MRAHPAGPRHADLVSEALPAAPPADLNALAEHIWPIGMKRAASGELVLNGRSVPDLVSDAGTPVFLLDEEDFRTRARAYASAFAGADVYYASKAFSSVALLGWVADEGLGLDVATGGELALADRSKFPMEHVLFHGNNKSIDELTQIVRLGVGRVVIDSTEEIRRLARCAEEAGVRQRVLVRVTVGVEAHTHEYIATAHEDQKFGFSLASGAAARAVELVLGQPSLELVGIHSHIGSQIFDTAGFEVAAHRTVGLLADIRARHGIELAELNLGGGLGIAYVDSDDPADVADVAASLHEIVQRECRGYEIPVPRLAVEPGRALVGPGMVTVYEVGTVKKVDLDGGASRTYVSVDGGMSDNPRTSLYDANYTVALADRHSDAAPMLARVVGKHCESGDIVVRDAWLPDDVRAGDLLVVAATGAYCRSMASNYNLLGRPPVVAVSADGTDRVLIRRETEEDLLALDTGV